MTNKILISLAIWFASTAALATAYTVDPSHTNVGFKIPHLMISSVQGRFDKFTADFTLDEATGKLENLNAKIDLDSINTNEPKRDDHLRSKDFFGVRGEDKKLVEAKRWMTFKSTKVVVKNKKPTSVIGDLTLNGVTKPLALNVVYKGSTKDPWGNQRAVFEATGKMSRKDYGLTWNKALETGGFVVGDDLSIVIDGEAIAAKSTEAAAK
jgi:polyisoprenoid-binding protein YceI